MKGERKGRRRGEEGRGKKSSSSYAASLKAAEQSDTVIKMLGSCPTVTKNESSDRGRGVQADLFKSSKGKEVVLLLARGF